MIDREHLHDLIGVETSIDEVSRQVCYLAQKAQTPVVGALQLTCADESEAECSRAFQTGVVQHLLPSLKFAHQSPFRLANPGARYEWGCLPLTEDHFATQATADGGKVIVAKINAHVSLNRSEHGPVFGTWTRYDSTVSHYCGALHALMAGSDLPFVRDLHETFTSDGLDRVAMLRDESQVDPAVRPLFAAICSARLQARAAIMDVQDHPPKTPTLWIILPSVTFNLAGRDNEILCGVYIADDRTANRRVEYRGLGDDPSAYEIEWHHERVVVVDGDIGTLRAARDHRQLAREQWRAVKDLLPETGSEIHRVVHKARELTGKDAMNRALLKTALGLLVGAAPVPAAVLLFAQGLAGIHHAHRIRSLVRRVAGDEEARTVVEEVTRRVDDLPPEKARDVLKCLAETYRGK